MDDNIKLWNDCLAKMQQYVKPHIFGTWFMPITCERYDTGTNTVTLRLPSKFICDYIEEHYLRLLTWALNETFKPGVRLQYRILQNADGFPVDFTLDAAACRTYLKVADAEQRLRCEMGKYVKGELQWLHAYDRVARWLTDNKGRGLLCLGTNGLGKSIVCQRVLPAILQQSGIVKCQATDMASRIDELMKARCVIIDDLGKEPDKHYGQTDRSFYKLCNAAEHTGTLLIITTNLSTTPVSDPRYPDSIEHRYGADVLSRLRSLVLPVLFEGKDMRQ